jgi:hypothetical protein
LLRYWLSVVINLAWRINSHPSTVPGLPLEADEVSVEESTPSEDVMEKETGEPAGGEGSLAPAKRIVQVPDTRREVETNGASQGPSLEAMVRPVAADAAEDLEKTLDGNLSSAIKLKRALVRCEKVPETEPGLESIMGRLTRLLAHREKIGHPAEAPFEPTGSLPGHILFPTVEQNRIRQTALFEECNKMRTVFTGGLRKQLDEMAKNGDVMARYLYAVWPPALTFTVDSLESDLEWAQKAYAYSAENLVQGEPAGLLAFGQSYSHGLFTRENGPLGEAVIRAGLRCESGDGDARIAEAFADETFQLRRIQRDGYPMHEDPEIVAFEERLSELCR